MIQLKFVMKSDGRFEIPSDKRLLFQTMKQQSDWLEVEVRPVYQRRSLSQNNLYQTLVKELCICLGERYPEHMKELIKQKAVYMGYPCEKDEHGLDMFVGDMPVPKSSRDVSVEEFEILIEACYMVAEENDIHLEVR